MALISAHIAELPGSVFIKIFHYIIYNLFSLPETAYRRFQDAVFLCMWLAMAFYVILALFSFGF